MTRSGTANAKQEERPPRVCAVVVAYYPDTGFQERVHAQLSQVAALIVVENTPRETEAYTADMSPAEQSHVHHVANGANRGIATALNQGLRYAAGRGCEWLLTVDQDTRCHPDMVRTLLDTAAFCTPRLSAIPAAVPYEIGSGQALAEVLWCCGARRSWRQRIVGLKRGEVEIIAF